MPYFAVHKCSRQEYGEPQPPFVVLFAQLHGGGLDPLFLEWEYLWGPHLFVVNFQMSCEGRASERQLFVGSQGQPSEAKSLIYDGGRQPAMLDLRKPAHVPTAGRPGDQISWLVLALVPALKQSLPTAQLQPQPPPPAARAVAPSNSQLTPLQSLS